MKIAIQLFGHMRSFKKTYKSFFRHIVMPNSQYADVDIFIHTWNYYNSTDDANGACSDRQNKKLNIKLVNKTYSPLSIAINEQQNICGREIRNRSDLFVDVHRRITGITAPKVISYKRIYNMYYSMNKVNGLRVEYENNNKIKYDYVLVTRPDILFHSNLVIKDIIDLSIATKGISPSFNEFSYGVWDLPIITGFSCEYPRSGISIVEPQNCDAIDCIFFSSGANITNLTKIFTSLKTDRLYEKNFFSFENYFSQYIRDNNMQIQLMPYIKGREWDIIRYKKR